MSTLSVSPNGGVGLLAMQEQFAAELAARDERFNAVMAEIAAMKSSAVKPASLAVPSGSLAVPQAVTPAIAKVAAVPMNTAVWKVGQPLKMAGTPTAKTASSSGKPCGTKSPNGLCRKCGSVDANGVFHGAPFHPVRHYSMDAILRLDGSAEAITHETWKTAKFIGISTDGDYWGNVVFVGFGKDCLNFRPKGAYGLAVALGGEKCAAALHIKGVLTANNGAHLLA